MKTFISSGYYADETSVLIQINKNETVSLYNTFYEAGVENLKVQKDINGAYVEAAGKRYYISNFIQNSDLLSFQINQK